MKKFDFRTSASCSGCVRTISQYLGENKDIEKFTFDLQDPVKNLTVYGTSLSAESVIKTVQEAGYAIEQIND